SIRAPIFFAGLLPGWLTLLAVNGSSSLLDPQPLRDLISTSLDLERVRSSPVRLLVTATDLVRRADRAADDHAKRARRGRRDRDAPSDPARCRAGAPHPPRRGRADARAVSTASRAAARIRAGGISSPRRPRSRRRDRLPPRLGRLTPAPAGAIRPLRAGRRRPGDLER